MIQIENAGFQTSSKTLLHPLTTQFERGKFYGLIGHNGSGKSTLLKLLARDAIASSDVRRAVEAKKALQFLALLKPGEMDLNVVRAEIIDRILKMLARAEARASR